MPVPLAALSAAAVGVLMLAGFANAITPQEDATTHQDDQDLTADDKKEFELPGIVVIGRRADTRIPEVPLNSIGSRDIFTPERVRETGARDLNDLIQNLPAVSTRPYNGGEAAAPSFSMRGLPDDGLTEYIHVLIDGVPASPMPYGWTAFSFLPIATERVFAVDFIRGGHAVRYSPNTVGGVLNFITSPIPVEPTLESSSTYGTFDYSSHLLSVGQTTDSLGAVVSYVDRRGDGYRDHGEFDQQDVNVKLRYDLGEGSFLATSITHMENTHQAPGGLTQAQFAVDRFGNARPEGHFDGFRSLIDVVWHQAMDEDGYVEWFSQLSQAGRELVARRPRFGTPTDLALWTDESFFGAIGARAERSVELLGLEHTLYGGFRVQREWLPHWKLYTQPFSGGPRIKTQDAEYTLQSYAVHLDDTIHPTEDLTVTFGARVEWIPTAEGEDELGGFHFDDDFLTVLPGVGASYTITDRWALFASYFEGFRSPQVWGFGLTNPGDTDIDFEEGRSYELGSRVRGPAGFSGSVTLWRTVFDDFFVFYTGFYENLGKIVSDGVDLVVDWNAGDVVEELQGVSLSGSITFQDAALRSGPNRSNDVPYAWDQKAAWRARYETTDLWHVSLGGVYVGESFSDELNTRATSADGQLGLNEGWVVWDARVAKGFELGQQADLELAVGATNLFDQEWEVHSRGGFFGGGLVAGAPRQVYTAVHFTCTW